MSNFVCHNCGKCCGPVTIVEEERKRIENFLQINPSVMEKVKKKGPSFDCVFRDEEKGCLIYPARPEVCKAYTCSSPDWAKKFKPPNGRPQLINNCFGVATSAETFTLMFKDYLDSIQKKH